MPRKINKTDVQIARSEWYEFHYQNRQLAAQMPAETLHTLQYLAAILPPPELTPFGGTPKDWITPDVFRLSYKHGVDVNLICPWYLSTAGWKQFQDLWRNLPEPVDLYTEGCVQVGDLYTLYTTDQIERPITGRV